MSLSSTQAIILHAFPYSDTSSIVRTFTRKQGYTTFLFKGVRQKKNKKRPFLFPLNLVEIKAVFKPHQELLLGQAVQPYFALASLVSDPIKGTISMFLGEWISRIMNFSQADEVLFDWLESSIVWLDGEQHVHNFHLAFLTRLMHFFGISPVNNYCQEFPVFSLNEHRFNEEGQDGPFLPKELSKLLSNLLSMDIAASSELKLSRFERQAYLEFLYTYYQTALQTTFKLNSLEVLRQVFEE